MKKSLVLVLGLAFITAGIIPFSSASRNAYHAYITSQANSNEYRHFAEGRRVGSGSNTAQSKTTTGRVGSARYQRNSRVNYSAPAGNSIYLEAGDRNETDTKIRPFATRAGIAPWRASLKRTGLTSRVIMPLANATMSFETFENNAFSVQLPVGATAKANDAHAFIAGDLDIRIKKFDAQTCNNAYGFQGCATNITRSENSSLVGGKGRLIAIDRTVRQTYKSDSVLDQVNLQTNVYTEEFTTEFTDGAQYTLYRYAVQDVDGGVYFIEVKIPRREAANYVGAVDKMFDSFRIYSQQ